MGNALPTHGDKNIVDHIATGLGKVAIALRSRAWEGGAARRLTPTQGQILAILAERGQPMRLSEVADELSLTAATASDAVLALVEKQLVKKARSPHDRRALTMTLTAAGRREARQASGWTDVVKAGVMRLTSEEQAVFLRGLTKVIHSLQAQGVISVARMCANCTYFHPYRHADSAQPHHCAFIDKPMGDAQLRMECSDCLPRADAEQAIRWQRFVNGNNVG